jgi:protein O-mannosyl-transferase
MPSRRIWIAAMLTLSALVYARALTNQFVYDDNEEVRLNHFIGQWSFVWRSFVNDSWWFRDPAKLPQSAYYRPLQDAWFALNYHAFSMNPAGWHLTMIVLEVVVVWLVFRVAEELTGDFVSALCAGGLFAVMPVHAQAVAWPSAIPLPMAAAFELGALLLIVRGAARTNSSIVAAAILYALALLSHESAIMFPALIVAYAFLFGSPIASGPGDLTLSVRVRGAIVSSAPFIIVAVAYLAARFAVLGFIARPNVENHMSAYSLALTTVEVIGQYLLLLVIPWRADPSHSVMPITTESAQGFYMTVLGLCALGGAAWAILTQRLRVPVYQFCVIWILLFLVPVLNLGALNPVELIADRYLFLPSTGWCILLGTFAGELIDTGAMLRTAVFAALSAMMLASAAILWHVENYWHDEIALFGRAAEISPGAALWHERLGMALKSEGRLDDAGSELALADALDPQSGTALYNVALIHLEEGHSNLAFTEMVRALPRIKDAPPQAYGEAARIAMQNGDLSGADRLLQQASDLPGGGSTAAIGRAEIRLIQHDDRGAAAILENATARYPDDPDAWALLAKTDTTLGDYPAALIASDQAVVHSPNAGWFHMLHAELLDKAGRHDEATAEYREAIEVQPDDAELRKTVAQMKPEALR